MFDLVSKTNFIIPKSLFMVDVKTETMTGIAIGGFGRVFKGIYKGSPVALKVVDKGHTNVGTSLVFPFNNVNTDSFDKVSLRKDFCREALAWKSLSHQFIIPLLGIFEERDQLFLVSPFMANGTLTDWRNLKEKPGSNKIGEIHRLVRLLCFKSLMMNFLLIPSRC